MAQIQQAYVSRKMASVERRLRSLYDLSTYRSPTQPALFYGCYSRPDLHTVLSHRSLAVVVWTGKDVLDSELLRQFGQERRSRMMPIKHIATSRWISGKLEAMRIPHSTIAIAPVAADYFKPEPLGERVYVYAAKPGQEKDYGLELVQSLRGRLPQFEFIFCYGSPESVPYARMHTVYSNCFIGLRLTTADGCPSTVVELGLMGRRCIWNGALPNALPWRNIDDIEATIREEAERIGTTDVLLRDAMLEVVNPGNAFSYRRLRFEHRAQLAS